MPRHYVLLVGQEGDQLQFYEPSSGEIRSVSVEEALSGDTSQPAFGGWSSIYGAYTPEN